MTTSIYCSNVCLTLQIGAIVNTIMLIGLLLMLVIMGVGVSAAKEEHRLSLSTSSPIDDDYENINKDMDQTSFELMQNNIGMGKKGTYVCPGEVLVSDDKQEVINNDKSRILSQGLYNQLCIYLYPD